VSPKTRAVWTLASAVVVGPLLYGCGGGTAKNEVVIPAKAPSESGKDSMDFYKANHKSGTTKK